MTGLAWIAERSYEWPSDATTGSIMMSCVTGQRNSLGVMRAPRPSDSRRALRATSLSACSLTALERVVAASSTWHVGEGGARG